MKQLITTGELIDFARRHRVPLGRRNPRRTLGYYIRLGLLPPRRRTSKAGRFSWGFPPEVKAILLRLRDLRRDGQTLHQIRQTLAEEFREVEQAKNRRAPRLHGFSSPSESLRTSEEADAAPGDFDYSDLYREMQVTAVLDALQRGDLGTARAILAEMLEVAQRLRAGHRFRGIITGAPDVKLSLGDLWGLIHGAAITMRVTPRAELESLARSVEVPEVLKIRGVDAQRWLAMSVEERRATAAVLLANPALFPASQGGVLHPVSEVPESSDSEPHTVKVVGTLPGEFPKT